jgi:hypothetical protein
MRKLNRGRSKLPFKNGQVLATSGSSTSGRGRSSICLPCRYNTLLSRVSLQDVDVVGYTIDEKNNKLKPRMLSLGYEICSLSMYASFSVRRV